LWEDRYRSVIVEADGGGDGTLGHAARVVAAYIDLNPVRAGVTGDPKDYGWCGYARAMAGEGDCVQGILSLWGETGGAEGALARHRLFLFDTGSDEWVEKTQDGKMQDPRTGEMKTRHGIDARLVKEERERGGKLPLAEVLRVKSRHLVDGGVVGSRGFVEKVAAGNRGKEAKGATSAGTGKDGQGGSGGEGGKRNPGEEMRLAEWGGLHVLRKWRKDVAG
jgi:putative transposase